MTATRISALNDVLQQMPGGTEDALADVMTWLVKQPVAVLRGIVDLNGDDAEGLTRGQLTKICLDMKGYSAAARYLSAANTNR
jgi:hypothetical protein